MDNLQQDFPHSEDLLWTNGSGSTAAAGVPIIIKGRAYVPVESILNGASGMVAGVGRFKVDKTTGQGALVVGQALGWDPVAKKTTTDLSQGAYFRVDEAAGTNDTTVVVSLDTTRRCFRKAHAVSAGEDAANQVDFVHNWGANPSGPCIAVIRSTVSGLQRFPGAVTFPDVNTVRVADTGGGTLTTNDVISIEFWE